MIAAMRFAPPESVHAGRLLRSIRFERCSSLPISAMCVVANGVREALSRLLAADIDLDLGEPAMPEAQGKAILFDGALVYRVRGRLCDAFIVLRRQDALRLAGVAFRETQRDGAEPLSSIERQTVDRIVASLASECAALCGSLGSVAREEASRAQGECATYFEIRTNGVAKITIGFALTRDPGETIGERLGFDRLLDVPLETRVEAADGVMSVPEFMALTPGSVLALRTGLHEFGAISIGGARFARVRCGERGARTAVTIEAVDGRAA